MPIRLCACSAALSQIQLKLETLQWCHEAARDTWANPKLERLTTLMKEAERLNIIQDVSILRALEKRAADWAERAEKEVSRPYPEPFDVEVLAALQVEKDNIPVQIKQERKVSAILEDGGERYCLCKGPSDGSFMIGCDTCEEWFHGRCVRVSAKMGKKLEQEHKPFICPLCADKRGTEYEFRSSQAFCDDPDDVETEDTASDEKRAKEEWLDTFWPPEDGSDNGGAGRPRVCALLACPIESMPRPLE